MKRSYFFGRFGSLWWREGLPLFVGRIEITPNGLVLWFPWNWVVVAVALIFWAVQIPFKRSR